MSKPSLIFDLDGTLWDPSILIASAWNRVVKRENIAFREISSKDIRTVTGLPHDECVRVLFDGLSESDIIRLNLGTQEEDQTTMGDSLPLFPGVMEGLAALSTSFSLYIVSNCQRGYIEKFLDRSGLRDRFIGWTCWGDTGLVKSKNLKQLILEHGLSTCAYIGDTEGDESAAAFCNIPFYFVGYGYGIARYPLRTFHTFPSLVDYFNH